MPGESGLAELVVGKVITQVRMGRNNIFITLKNKLRKQCKFYKSVKIFVKHENFGKEKVEIFSQVVNENLKMRRAARPEGSGAWERLVCIGG